MRLGLPGERASPLREEDEGALLHEPGRAAAGEVGSPEVPRPFEVARGSRGLEAQGLPLEGREGFLEEEVGGLQLGGGPEIASPLPGKEKGEEPLPRVLGCDHRDRLREGLRGGKALKRVEDREDEEAAALVLGDRWGTEILAHRAGWGKVPFGQEGIVETAGLEAGGEARLPGVVGKPAASGTLAEGPPQVGSKHLHLPETIGARDEGHKRRKIASAQELDLLPGGHLFQEHEKFGMAGLEPAKDGARVMKHCGDVGKPVEHR